jgi:DNA-binding transcriptional regulator GbsR (MarR family)
MRLTEPMRRFVLHWGEMGQRWGVNRSVAQVHALLYLSDEPLVADEIVEALGVARSNVSTSLKELQGWELVRLVHVPGDRRDHFEAKHDPWDVLVTIVEGRKRREIDPTISMLREVSASAAADAETPEFAKAKIQAMGGFLEEMNGLYAQWRDVPAPVLRKLLSLGLKATQLIGR